MEIRGKTVLVTGASEGIGRATAIAFARAGARIVLAARRLERLDEVAKEIAASGGEAFAVVADVADDASVDAMARAATERFGGVDILVNNAGYGLMGPLAELAVDDVRQNFEVNVFGVLRCVRAVVPEMRRRGGGHIVNVSSVLGGMTLPYLGPYAATKHALNALTASLRAELRPDRIGVSLIVPGRIDTGFSENAQRPTGHRSPGAYRGIPPERVAAAILGAVRHNRRRVTAPFWYWPIPVARALAPDIIDARLEKKMRRENAD